MAYYARSLAGRSKKDWQRLEEHLERVSAHSAESADAFGAADWGALAGLWHDLGKYQDEFQARLEGNPQSVDHSIIGALRAKEAGLRSATPLVFAIAGHHGGLPDVVELGERLRKRADALNKVRGAVPEWILRHAVPPLPKRFLDSQPKDAASAQLRSIEFFTRFLYSCLVDADALDAEQFRTGERRPGQAHGELPVLRSRLAERMDALLRDCPPTPVNQARRSTLLACRAAAAMPPGAFSLSAPTGMGKTLASLDFALEHALRHGLRRVIVVIPYTSIIEQNAGVYRDVLGSDSVIEHHSNLDPEKETERNRLASENWDAPVIVTTTVQFFESLFGARPSVCRKLHNIAKSVVILDEAQSLPLPLLAPILDGLRELTANYGCSVVISTATQPALGRRDKFAGISDIREIAPDAFDLGRKMKRCRIEWPRTPEPAAWEDLARQVAAEPRALVIVHRRQDARVLAEMLPPEGRFHLSALMCAKHRASVIGAIRERLRLDGPCRVVSTQLVEAGVDLDFPVVFRAMSGLDSIVQAAGRCNREGRGPTGRVVVFRAPTDPPPGVLKRALDVTETMLVESAGDIALDSPAVFEDFFRRLYFLSDQDPKGIQAQRASMNFGTVAERFKMIEDDYTAPVVVPYAGHEEPLERLRADGPTRETLRALQPYLVNLPKRDVDRLVKAGAVEVVRETAYALAGPFHRMYTPVFGFCIEDAPNPDPGSLVV